MRKTILIIAILLLIPGLAFAQVAANTAFGDLDADTTGASDDLVVTSDTSDSGRSKQMTTSDLFGIATDLDDGGGISSSGVAAGNYGSANIIVDADGRLTYAASGSLTGLSDVGSATQGSGRLLVSEGNEFESVVMSGDVTIGNTGVTTIGSGKVGTTELEDTAVATGTFQSAIIIVDADGRLTYAASGGLTGLSDIGSATQGAGRLLVSEGNEFESVAMSGDVTMNNVGVTTIGAGKVGSDELASSGVAASTYMTPTITVDADGRLTYAASGGLTGLSDVGSATQGAGRLLISEGNEFESLALSGDVTIDASGIASVVQIQDGAAPTISGVGDIGIDTTSDQLKYYGSAARALPYFYERGFVLEDPVEADDDIPIWHPKQAITITDVYCEVEGATSIGVIISDGTNALEEVVCDADGQADDGSIANGTFTANERMEVDMGTITDTPDWVAVTITYTVDAD